MALEWLKRWGQDTPRVHSFWPCSFEEAGEAATCIAQGDIVLLNVEHLEWEVARRVEDFLCGAAFVAGYSLHRTGIYNYVLLPDGVEFSEEIPNQASREHGNGPEEGPCVPPEVEKEPRPKQGPKEPAEEAEPDLPQQGESEAEPEPAEPPEEDPDPNQKDE